MRSRRRIITLTIGTFILAVPARGQGTAPSALATQYVDELAGLGLDTAIARALEREPSLRAVRSDIEAARGLQQQADLHPNPTLTFERRDEPGGTDNLTSIGIEWPLDLSRRGGRVQTAERVTTGHAIRRRRSRTIADCGCTDAVRHRRGGGAGCRGGRRSRSRRPAAMGRRARSRRRRWNAAARTGSAGGGATPFRSRAPAGRWSRRRGRCAAEATPRYVAQRTVAVA